MSATIPKGDVVDIGKIPRGKKYLSVFLNAKVDVDIQLFDTENATTFPEGKALIAYCEEDGCNKGILGNNDGTAESTTYNRKRFKLVFHASSASHTCRHFSYLPP